MSEMAGLFWFYYSWSLFPNPPACVFKACSSDPKLLEERSCAVIILVFSVTLGAHSGQVWNGRSRADGVWGGASCCGGFCRVALTGLLEASVPCPDQPSRE